MIILAGTCLLVACSPKASKPPYNLVLPVKEVMAHIVDPASQVFWRSSGDVVTEAGTQSLTPTTTEGWIAAENGAATVAEAGNLLMLPGRALDDGDWMKYSRQLTERALEARAAAEARDPVKMFQTGADLYQVCVACHGKYVMGAAAPDEQKPKP